MGWYSTISVKYDRHNALQLMCQVEDPETREVNLEFNLDYTFEDHDLIYNLSYEFDSGKYLPFDYVRVIEIIRLIFTSLDMNVDKYLDEFKNKIEETFPDMLRIMSKD